MPLNEREQRILEDIERHLYAEDPKLAQTVKKADLGVRTKRRQRLAAVGFIVGLVVMLGMFTRSTPIAGLGFVLMVASTAWLVVTMRSQRTEHAGSASVVGWMDGLRQRWRRDR
jgi:Flp pilus assembly protein TadB